MDSVHDELVANTLLNMSQAVPNSHQDVVKYYEAFLTNRGLPMAVIDCKKCGCTWQEFRYLLGYDKHRHPKGASESALPAQWLDHVKKCNGPQDYPIWTAAGHARRMTEIEKKQDCAARLSSLKQRGYDSKTPDKKLEPYWRPPDPTMVEREVRRKAKADKKKIPKLALVHVPPPVPPPPPPPQPIIKKPPAVPQPKPASIEPDPAVDGDELKATDKEVKEFNDMLNNMAQSANKENKAKPIQKNSRKRPIELDELKDAHPGVALANVSAAIDERFKRYHRDLEKTVVHLDNQIVFFHKRIKTITADREKALLALRLTTLMVDSLKDPAEAAKCFAAGDAFFSALPASVRASPVDTTIAAVTALTEAASASSSSMAAGSRPSPLTVD